MLSNGTAAPDFTLPDQNGNPVSLSALRGSWVVLWFYPRAGTPTCTREGRCFRDAADVFREAKAVIVGISFDTPEENLAFAQTENFGFRLLSDIDRVAGAAYEAVQDGTERPRRLTYVIDPSGVIAGAFAVTEVEQHPAAVLEVING